MTTINRPRPTLGDDDETLVSAHLAGDPCAFDEIFRRYQPRLVTFLTHRTGDPSAADDLAQETLVRAVHALDRFDTTRPLWPWLRRIATNAAIDWSRARTRSDALVRAVALDPPPPADPPDLAERDVMAQALADVPHRQRAALQRCYVEGWRPVDVADQFGVGSNAFEQLLHRARGNLRRAYLRREQPDRAAGLAWLFLAVRPVVEAVERLRRVAGAVGPVRLAEVAIASVAVTALVAVGPTREPAPRFQGGTPVERAEFMPDAPGAAPAGPDGPASSAAGSPAAGTPAVRDGAAVVTGAGRPAPVAADPAPEDPVAAPAPPLSPLPGVDRPAAQPPGSQAPPEEPDDLSPRSAPEVIGGCGSTVRGAVCDTSALLAQ